MPTLPAIAPSARTLTPGSFPTQRFLAINGAATRRMYGKLDYDYFLDLTYGNEGGLPDAQTESIYAIWEEAFGHTDPITLGASVFAGMDASLPAQISGHISWYFDEQPPQIETTIPGRSRITIRLRGRLT